MGSIRIYPRPTGGHIARTLVRDYDGVLRPVARTGKSKAAARNALTEAVRQRHIGHSTDITPDTKVDVVCEAWWEEFCRRNTNPNTRRLYRDRLDRQIIPSLGQLRVRELTVGVCDRHIQAVAQANGTGTAKTVRAVLSGVCKYAAKNDALERNVVRDVGTVAHKKSKTEIEAFTLDQARDFREKVRLDKKANRDDVVDLMDFMLATSLRLSEACAIEWDDLDLDDVANGTVRVGWKNVVREKGVGLYIRTEESNKKTRRTLELPGWAVIMLRARKARSTTSWVFPSPKGQLRDPSNTGHRIKDAFTAAGYGWATSHVFRRTVATLMDEYGLPPRAAADQLGHSKTITTETHYIARRRLITGAKTVLEGLTEIIHEESDPTDDEDAEGS